MWRLQQTLVATKTATEQIMDLRKTLRYVWRQQICGYNLNYTSIYTQQKA